MDGSEDVVEIGTFVFDFDGVIGAEVVGHDGGGGEGFGGESAEGGGVE